MEERILELSICEICNNYFNIVCQCPSGHVFCDKCAVRISKCPSCRTILPRSIIRNRIFEKILYYYGKINKLHAKLGKNKFKK